MSEITHSYTEPVSLLIGLGRPADKNKDAKWINYSELGINREHVDDLCTLLLDMDLYWHEGDDSASFAATHARRALSQIGDVRAIPALLKTIPYIDEFGDDWIAEDMPRVMVAFGEAALQPLTGYLVDARHDTWTRVHTVECLQSIAEEFPAYRERVVTALSGQLAHYANQDNILNSMLVFNLVELNAVESAGIIEEAFAADAIDLLVNGDWEDTQIELGLLDKRLTPKPDYRSGELRELSQRLEEYFNVKQEITALGRVPKQPGRSRSSTKKNRRKQAKKSRKKNKRR